MKEQKSAHAPNVEIISTEVDGLQPAQRFINLARSLFAVPKSSLPDRDAPKIKRDGTPKRRPGPPKGTPKPGAA